MPSGERAAYGYAVGLGAVVLTGGIVTALGSALSVADASMLHLLPVLIVAVRFGILPSIVTSIAAAISSNFLFAKPYFGFGFQDIHDAITLVVFVLVAATVNYWAGTAQRQSTILRQQADQSRREQREADILRRIGGRLSGLSGPDEIASAIESEMTQSGSPKVLIRLANDIGTATSISAHLHGRQIFPLTEDGATIGWLSILPEPDWSEGLCRSIAAEVSQALARTRRALERETARIAAESAKLQSTIVSSVSHDFHTPLTTIIGAASSLLDRSADFSPDARTDLLETIQDQGERLHRYVVNLLNTGRLEAGNILPNRDWLDIADVIATALAHLSPDGARERIALNLASDLPVIFADYILVEQTILNLLDNATKYSPSGSTVQIDATAVPGAIQLKIENTLAGPPPDIERMFERFYESPNKPRKGGSGLGLFICRGFVEVHAGTLRAEMRGDKIALIAVLPVGATPPQLSPDTNDD